jgi:hypothetical protein
MRGWGESRKDRARRRLRDRRRIMSRLMRRARHIYPYPEAWTNMYTWADVLHERRVYARLYYRNRKRCNGSCCHNPRAISKGMTPQEYRAELDAREQCGEAGLSYTGNRFRPHW